MQKNKNTIEESLGEIRKIMQESNNEEQNSNTISKRSVDSKTDFILLDKIVGKPKIKKNVVPNSENAIKNIKKNNEEKISVDPKKKISKSKDRQKLFQKNNKRKGNDPIAQVVEREVKPIIKKWINKNLRSFVKTLVIEEMKLISKATEKRTVK